MNIAIIGYGKMGKKVEELASLKGHKICARIDPIVPGADHFEISEEYVSSADVCIEFSNPGSVIENIKTLNRMEKNIVVGTTGWYENPGQVRELYTTSKSGMIYASNFSIGMNLLFRMTEFAAKMIDKFPEYDVSGMEIHHNKKLDSPSGTAGSLSKILIENIERKKRPLFDTVNRKISEDELHFASVRCGSFPGTHKILFDSPADTIEISHVVRNRDGFAFGALLAAEWIMGKSGIFTFNNLVNDLLNIS